MRGNRQSHAIMTNVLYDFSFPNFAWPVTPHVGAGIGAVNVIDRARSTNFGQVSRGGLRFDSRDTAAVPTEDLGSSFAYTVDSRVVEPSFEQLNQAFDYSAPQFRPFTQLPAGIPTKIGDEPS